MPDINPRSGGPPVRTMAAMLRDSEERFLALFEHSDMGIALVEPDGSFLQVNPAWTVITGYSRRDLEGRRLQDLITAADQDLYDLHESALWAAGHSSVDLEVRCTDKSGATGWMRLILSVIRPADGQPPYVIVQMRDLGAQKRAEASVTQKEQTLRLYATELARSHQELQSLIGQMAEGMIAVDEHWRLAVINPAASRLLGVSPTFIGHLAREPLLPKGLVELLDRVALPDAADAIATFAFGDLHLKVHAAPLAVGGAVAVLQNVTAEVHLQRLRESFMTDASHEMRGPLTSLTAVMEALRDGLIPPNVQQRYVEQALAELKRLQRLVDDLLELSKIDHGIVRVSPTQIDLQPLTTDLAERWRPRAQAGGVQLEVECPEIRVFADYDRVQQVLTNLLSNAVRFTPRGGTVRIVASSEGQMARISVIDTGVGIEPAHLPFVWDRFYKTDPARTRTGEGGTGLGLAIAKQLVEVMGGQVGVESAPGKGSAFSFTLPAAPPPS